MRCAKPLVLGLLVALSLARPAHAAAVDTRAETLIRESVEAPKTISYVGQLQTIRWSSSRASATIARIEHLAPEMTRRWFLAPEALYGDYIVTRGITSYQFDVKNSRVTVSKNPAVDNQVATNDNLGLLSANYRAVLGPTENIAGRPASSVWLINRFSGERALRVWIDSETKLVLQKEAYHANGSISYQTRFDQIRYTRDIPPDLFASTVPQGFTQSAGHDYAQPSTDLEKVLHDAGFSPVGPRYLPDGFSIVSGDVNTVKGVRTLHLLYSDGVRSLSLFENATGAAADFGRLKPKTTRFEKHDAQYVEDGQVTLLAWQEKGLHFALVSDLGLREMKQIATSVVP